MAGTLPDIIRTEEVHQGSIAGWVNPVWEARFPWLAQGVTAGANRDHPGDFGLLGRGRSSMALEGWSDLAAHLGFPRVVYSRQRHGRRVLLHEDPPRGVHQASDADGHVSATPGILMGVTVADCVPAFLLDPGKRATAILHAGWRGTAAGVLEEALDLVARCTGSTPSELLVHLGPAVCGSCYEVGPEVHRALGLPEPVRPEPVDLRGVLVARSVDAG